MIIQVIIINAFKYDLSQKDFNNIKNPEYWYTFEKAIVNILTAALNDKKVSIQPAILPDAINKAFEDKHR